MERGTHFRRAATVVGVSFFVAALYACGGDSPVSHAALDNYSPRSVACSAFTRCLDGCIADPNCDGNCGGNLNVDFNTIYIPGCYRSKTVPCTWGPDCLIPCAGAIEDCARFHTAPSRSVGAPGSIATPRVGSALAGTWSNKEASVTFAGDGSYRYTTNTYLWASTQNFVESGVIDDDGSMVALERRSYAITDGTRTVTSDYGASRMSWLRYTIVSTDTGPRLGLWKLRFINGEYLAEDRAEGDYFYRR